MDNSRVAALADVARQLRDLEKTPGWEALRRVADSKTSKDVERLAKQIVATGEVDPAEANRLRGFTQGVSWLLSRPTRVQAELEKELRELESREGDDA